MNPTPPKPYRLLWITAEVQGGIASYSQMLWPAVAEAAKAAGDFFEQGWRGPLNRMTNATMLPWMSHRRREGTWGRFDGVIAHSAMQVTCL